MPEANTLPPFSSAFTFVRAAQYGGALQATEKSANAHEVGKRLMAGDPEGVSIVAAHAIYGIADLLAIVKGKSPEDLIKQVHSRVREGNVGQNSYIVGTGSYLITQSFGKPLDRSTFAPDGRPSAWVLATVGVPDPAAVLADRMLDVEGIELVAPVFGDPYDVFIYVRHRTPEHIQWIIDTEIRPLRNFISTTTLVVTSELKKRP